MGQPAAIGRFGVGFNAVYHLVGGGWEVGGGGSGAQGPLERVVAALRVC
jgi:hypothetical protein